MKKEYLLVFILSLFILAYVIDYISGPVALPVKNPYAVLDPVIVSKFPLTSLGIIARSLGLVIATFFLFSLVENLYTAKALLIFFISVLFELYAIQQVSTGSRTTTIQWTISLALSGLLLLPSIPVYFLKGLISLKLHPSNNLPEDTHEET